ncbi:hypothetical protein BJ138DRAFT_1145394 [Hygrophoropsis aurantiaca]|uniref:Uncharacterized protein n=1 Tax=Hygrophoropsis aurantiaca TaxID=72124 RepID=A0ACB8ALC1_9AGAM|nr:hypothetical protein BJ138DRAFT_1145394 [Hygrophoropsis aurantiaca]
MDVESEDIETHPSREEYWGHDAKSMLRPITAIQALNAEQAYSSADLTIDGQFILNVVLVAHIVSIELRSATIVRYVLEDGTGRLCASRGMDPKIADQGIEYDQKFLGNYARICGKIKRFGNQTHLDIDAIQLANYDEVMYHILHAITTTFVLERGRPPRSDTDANQRLFHLNNAMDVDNGNDTITTEEYAQSRLAFVQHPLHVAQAVTLPNTPVTPITSDDEGKNKTQGYTSFLGLSPETNDYPSSSETTGLPLPGVIMSPRVSTPPITPKDKGKGKAVAGPINRGSFLGLSPDSDDEEIQSSLLELRESSPSPASVPIASSSRWNSRPIEAPRFTSNIASTSRIDSSSTLESGNITPPPVHRNTTPPPHIPTTPQHPITPLKNFADALRLQSPLTARRHSEFAKLTALQREILLSVSNSVPSHPEGISAMDMVVEIQIKRGTEEQVILQTIDRLEDMGFLYYPMAPLDDRLMVNW